jgi:predicted regulator of Ras-like GTPase activity (Roadblock/LC7/MglB family)
MRAILDDLKDVPGVTGVFVCDGEGKVLASTLQTAIAPELLDRVAKVLGRTAAGVHTIQGKGPLDLEMVYEAGVLLLKPLEPGCLCIICVAKVNIPMLNLTANMAVRQLKKSIAVGAGAAATLPAAGGDPIPAGAVSQIEHDLAVAVGPVAMLVVDETLAKLRCTRETLTEAQSSAFLNAVAAEIPDAAKKARFLESAKRILAPRG